VGASTSHIPLGFHGLLQGQLSLLHDIATSQEMALFIATAVRTTDPAYMKIILIFGSPKAKAVLEIMIFGLWCHVVQVVSWCQVPEDLIIIITAKRTSLNACLVVT
jgi:hypothetical protein